MTLGADAIVATAPFYAQVTEATGGRAALPVVEGRVWRAAARLRHPGRGAQQARPRQLLTLAGDHVIDGLKDSSGDLAGMREVIIGTGPLPEFAVFTGSELVVDCAMQVGASGAVPGLGNVDPRGFVELYRVLPGRRLGQSPRPAGASDHSVRITQCAKPGRAGAPRASVGSRQPSCFAALSPPTPWRFPRPRSRTTETAAVREVLVTTGLL